MALARRIVKEVGDKLEGNKVVLAYDTGYFMCGNDVFELPLPSVEKLTYMALIKYAGSNNRAWPSYDTLARDASCSRRRAVYAVDHLCNCKLVVKERRGNRSNIYMVYPPSFYCCSEDERDNLKNMSSVPQEKPRVQNLHPEGAESALSGCTACTVRVQNLHPNINNNSTMNITTQQKIKKEEEKKEERNLYINEKDIETVKKAFKAKRVVVKDSIILNLLENYPANDVQAAIKSTDFNQARNPIAVIKWMLKEGSYVMPAENTAAAVIPEYNDEPIDYEFVKAALREAKAMINQ